MMKGIRPKFQNKFSVTDYQVFLVQLMVGWAYFISQSLSLSHRNLGNAGNWSDLQKQLREFTLNTQQELEQERAELMSKNAMLEQEVEELHDYIDTHLSR